MPPNHSVYWNKDWVGLEGIYIRPAHKMKGVSQVYFDDANILCGKETGWLVADAQLEHL